MKVILRTDVEKLGKIGTIVEVKPGYARNYLIPQGFAYLADRGSLRRFEEEKKQLMSEADRSRSRAEALKERIESQEYTIAVKTGDKGRLYGSVTAHNVADLLKEAGLDIDRRRIMLEVPIKRLGAFELPIKLYGDIQAIVRLNVEDADAGLRAALEAEIEAAEAAERGELPPTEEAEEAPDGEAEEADAHAESTEEEEQA